MSKHWTRIILASLACATIGLASSQARVAPGAALPKPWAFLAWDKDVGRVIGNESDSEGPKSFAVRPDGTVLVLDQVNQRILDLDAKGAVTGIVDLPTGTFDDVEQFEGRAVIAIDRLVTRTLRVMDNKGAVLTEVGLEGRGIERPGLVTAMLPRPDGVWLEVQHRHSVKVLDRTLAPCDRQIVLGRPMANGLSLHAELDGRGGVNVSIARRGDRAAAVRATLTADSPIRRIVWSDTDAKGRVHVVLHEADFASESPFRVRSERYLMVMLDDQLREVRRTESPWVLTTYDQRGEFRLGPDGTPWQMAFTDDGVQLIDWQRRAQ